MYHQEGWKQLLYGKLSLACKWCTQIQSFNVDLGLVGSSICVLLSGDIRRDLGPLHLQTQSAPTKILRLTAIVSGNCFDTIPQPAKAAAGRAFGCGTTFPSTVPIHQRSLGCWPGSGATWRV